MARRAAHRSLPIPTYVRVTNEDNGASMVLRVNDRGPFHSDRLIDLSYGAAVRLGFADQGTASVLVEAIDVPGMQDVRSDVANGYSRLQLGAFSTRSAAEALAQRVAQLRGAHDRHLAGRKLDGERNTVELLNNRFDDRAVGGGECGAARLRFRSC